MTEDTTTLSNCRQICGACESVLRRPGIPMSCGAREDQAEVLDRPLTDPEFCPKGKHKDALVPLTIQMSSPTNGAKPRKRRGIKHYAKGAFGMAKALTGIDAASKEVEAKRSAICATCEHRKPSAVGDRCEECGCFIQLKVKVKGQSCPVGKWGAVTE